jgi:heat shock protein HtpX
MSLAPSLSSGNLLRQRPLLRGASYARTALFLGALTALVVLAADVVGGPAWALFALVFMGVTNFASWWFSDRLVVALHRARPLPYDQAPHVHDTLRRLSRRAGLPMPRIVLVPDPAPNAFATGRGPDHAVVGVTHGLVELLDPDELEGVLAHELAHVAHRDILLASIAATLAGAISLLARTMSFALLFGSRRDDEEQNPLHALLLVIAAPLIALLIQMAVSRSREYEADATGAKLAGSPLGLAKALRKLHSVSRRVPMRMADPATSHLYIVAPLFARSVIQLFATHPLVEDRIRRLVAMR